MKEEVTIKCDASEKGLGSTYLQKGQAVEQHAQVEKECPAMVFACSISSASTLPYVKVTVESDHKQPQPIFEKSLLAASCRLQGDLLQYQRYDLEVQRIPDSQCL